MHLKLDSDDQWWRAQRPHDVKVCGWVWFEPGPVEGRRMRRRVKKVCTLSRGHRGTHWDERQDGKKTNDER